MDTDDSDYNKVERFTCQKCGKDIRQLFCSRCDCFFNAGHAPDCERDKERQLHMLCQQYCRSF
jgi:hypothetical protein